MPDSPAFVTIPGLVDVVVIGTIRIAFGATNTTLRAGYFRPLDMRSMTQPSDRSPVLDTGLPGKRGDESPAARSCARILANPLDV